MPEMPSRLRVSLPLLRPFACDPARYCEGKSACCQKPDTRPVLDVVDYCRLRQKTGETLPDIWRTKGMLEPWGSTADLQFALGLRHDPCPYLSDKPDCRVHEARPLSCALFPFTLFLNKRGLLPSARREYKCIAGARLSERQVRFAEEISGLYQAVCEAEDQYFWQGRLPQLGRFDQVRLVGLLREAGEKAATEAPHMIEAVAAARALYRSKAQQHAASGAVRPLNLQGSLCEIVSPALYAIYYREFTAKLTDIERFHLSVFAALNDRISEIFGRYGM